MREQHFVPLSHRLSPSCASCSRSLVRTATCFPCVQERIAADEREHVERGPRRLGYDKDTMTAHGFRSMASSLLNEQQWHGDVIERQLAHGERDKVRGMRQLRRTTAGTAEDDAGVGGLPRHPARSIR